jgi:hypothetical protein
MPWLLLAADATGGTAVARTSMPGLAVVPVEHDMTALVLRARRSRLTSSLDVPHGSHRQMHQPPVRDNQDWLITP